ncbi:hypothetical protein SAY87_030579 [Trapa incisa]|uniref:GATA transcription factor n=1 Tax=Trapa incisa TaxID=236973 RepID=A0AAN7KVX6_9MYRT|nr:hypothetical protein SAY87_030579 [Trapa incisa]
MDAPDQHPSVVALESKEQHFAVEDLLDFSKDNGGLAGDEVASRFDGAAGGNSTDSSTVTAVDSCNSATFSGCGPGHAAAAVAGGGEDVRRHAGFGENDHFSSELCVPYDDLAELEWLSNFVEESFSTEDMQKLQMISGIKQRPDEESETTCTFQPEPAQTTHHHQTTNISNPIFDPDVSVPAKARSKRSRASPSRWASRIRILTEPTESSYLDEQDGSTLSTLPATAAERNPRGGAKRRLVGSGRDFTGEARRCLHCATDKTPQWRTGPMGPKTLCNACGVRYKSGRLVPEYRPAASPTFMLTKHSNSHRKVLELRRQKELLRAQQQHQQHFGLQGLTTAFDTPNTDDYLIHQHVGPDYRQMM